MEPSVGEHRRCLLTPDLPTHTEGPLELVRGGRWEERWGLRDFGRLRALPRAGRQVGTRRQGLACSTAFAAAHASGLPPKVDACVPGVRTSHDALHNIRADEASHRCGGAPIRERIDDALHIIAPMGTPPPSAFADVSTSTSTPSLWCLQRAGGLVARRPAAAAAACVRDACLGPCQPAGAQKFSRGRRWRSGRGP